MSRIGWMYSADGKITSHPELPLMTLASISGMLS